jgi:CCR4-NOT transcriptional regulation complex NOT5 subunit
VPLECGFFQVDLLIVRELFQEEKIPFFVDTQMSSSALPIESETTNYAKVQVPKSLLEKAREKIDSHFRNVDGVYRVKYSGIKDRLRSVSFYEVDLSEEELHETVEVSLSLDELHHIRTYLNRLAQEAEILEKESERVLFHIDNLEECLKKVEKNDPSDFSRADLLTILEALQVYCEEDEFPLDLDSTIEALLTFFGI